MTKMKISKRLLSTVSSANAKPVIVIGPSGVGKGTLLKKVREKYPGSFQVAVSHTSRKPRVGEQNGVHYNFVDRTNFEKMIKNNAFVEYADVHGNWYGTSIESIEKVTDSGAICLLEIDIQGAEL